MSIFFTNLSKHYKMTIFQPQDTIIATIKSWKWIQHSKITKVTFTDFKNVYK